MAKEKKMQVVEDDEIENVGIMSGFMDYIDGILAEIMEEEQEATSGEDDDMARVMGRTPDSPEILMNNLRGNMRSLDARREELAEMVGYNAAAETPDEVLAMLQPVLAEQEMAGIASFSPLNSGSPQAPPESLTPPASAGGVLSLPMGQEPMPAPMPAPMPMKDGGIVQHFAEGSTEEGVEGLNTTPRTPSGVTPEILEAFSMFPAEVVQQVFGQEMRPVKDATQLAKELEPTYADLLGVDKEAAKSQFLMNLGQAALRYAGNVGPSGERLSGSPLARLAAGFSDVPAAAAQAGATMAAQERQARLAALQGAQSQITADQAYNQGLLERRSDLLKEAFKQRIDPKAGQALSEEDRQKLGITGNPELEKFPWVYDEKGLPDIAGGRPSGGTSVVVGGQSMQLTPIQEAQDKEFGKEILAWRSGGGQDMTAQIAQLADVAQELEAVETGQSDQDLTGIFVGLTPDILMPYINPTAADAKANVEQVVQRNLRLILGAQFTEGEGVRLIKRAYDDALDEADNARRVRRLLLQMSASAMQKQAMVDYVEENGTLAGYKGKMPSISDFDNAIAGVEGFRTEDLIGNTEAGRDLLGLNNKQDED